MSETVPHILILVDWFDPAYKAGGPVRSVVNLVQALHPHARISILTGDRDYGDDEGFPGIAKDQWLDWQGKARVRYLPPAMQNRGHIGKLFREESYSLVYLNGIFSMGFTLAPLRALRSLKPKPRVLLAPRGMLHPGALKLKRSKKQVFLQGLKVSGVLKGVEFHATDEQEILDVRRVLGQKKVVHLASNLPQLVQPGYQDVDKEAGVLRLIYVSRVSLKKNLHLILEALKDFSMAVSLDVLGPEEEVAYATRCRALAAELPANVKVTFKGPVLPAEVAAALHNAHLFVLPTRGENFGHAIFESFLAGRPVLISDQTPWRNLEAAFAGWDLSLKEPGRIQAVLKLVGEMDQNAYAKWSKGAWDFAAAFLKDNDLVRKNIELFCT